MAEQAVSWRTASACHQGSCVEIGGVGPNIPPLIRDSKEQNGPILDPFCCKEEWLTFLEAAKRGDLDYLLDFPAA